MINNKENKIQIHKDKDNLIDLRQLKKHKVNTTKYIGIYFLFYKEELIYIGQSVNILARIEQHKKDKVFDTFCFKRVDKRRLDSVEKECIQYYMPKLNDIHNSNKVFKEVDVNILQNTAKYENGLMVININNNILKSEIVFIKQRKGYFKYNFRDIKAEFYNTNGSAIIKEYSFYVKFKTKTYIFKPQGGNVWKMENIEI